METVTLTIDGQQVTVEKGKTVLQAAIENGFSVPYYCYHPALGVDGSCRVCIVKIEKMPKLQTACSTICTDGMIVMTQTPDVVEARAGVFEFLLINHPLDCPVCDKGGECPLQDFSYSFGPDESRMEFPRRVFDGEGVKADVDFGPTLMLNRNRCILCTRCVRFMKEIDTDAQISIVDRGGGSEIATFQEEGRPLAPLGQPDGRVPGRRDHDARLPVQVAAVGQPGRGRHDLHALLEGLQHDGVDQGEAGMGEGRAAGAHHAAPRTTTSTATGCATSAASTTTGSKAKTGCASRSSAAADGTQAPATWDAALDGAWRPRPPRTRRTGFTFLVSAHASNEELFLDRAAGQRDCAQLDRTARRSSRRARSSRCRPWTRRT